MEWILKEPSLIGRFMKMELIKWNIYIFMVCYQGMEDDPEIVGGIVIA